MRCSCKNNILQKSVDGVVRLRTKGPIVFGLDGLAKAQCYWCGVEVTLPIDLKKNAPDEKFILRGEIKK